MKLEFNITGGLNNYDNYSRLDPGEVQDCGNMLFERRKAFSRPGLSNPVSLTDVVGPAVFAESVPLNAISYNMLVDTTNRIFVYDTFGLEIIAAGEAAAFLDNINNNACSVIGVVIFGNNSGGLVQWTPSAGNTYAVVAGAPFQYVTGHQGRAIAARQLSGGSSLLNARTFAWSTPGDVTSWTSTDGSAGQLGIAELEDQITGLGVLHNVVVIPHYRGIHLAYATGTLPLPYNVQPFIKKGVGCFFPSTSAWSEELYFFVGQEDVFYFDLTNVVPIGGKIRIALLTALNAGILYKGFVTRQQFGVEPRLRYNLFPINSTISPHYVYDIAEQKWSQHYYDIPAEWAWNAAQTGAGALDLGIGFVDSSNPPNLRTWQKGINCEKTSYFTRYMGVLESQELDFLVNDILLRTVDHGTLNLIATLTSILGDTASTATATKAVGGNSTGKWTRQFMSRGVSDLRIAGQEFVLNVTAAANQNFEIDYAALIVSDQSSGDYRGY